MTVYELGSEPNQSFYAYINNRKFSFDFHYFRGFIYVSVYIDDTIVQGGVRLIPNQSLFVDAVNDAANGEFQLMSNSTEYPNYSDLGGSLYKFTYIERA